MPELRYLCQVIFVVRFASADADMRPWPIMLLPMLIGILVVKLTFDAKCLPHFEEVGGVRGGVGVVAQLVLYLDHDDWPIVGV